MIMHVEFKPERNIFYYIYDNNQLLWKGRKRSKAYSSIFTENNLNKPLPAFTKEIEWEKFPPICKRIIPSKKTRNIRAVLSLEWILQMKSI